MIFTKSQGYNRLNFAIMCPQGWKAQLNMELSKSDLDTLPYIICLLSVLRDLALVQNGNILIEPDGKETGLTDPL